MSIQGILDLGWDEQTKYRVDPGFYQVDVEILVNLDKWKGLSDEQRALLEEGIAYTEALNANNVAINAEEAKKQEAAGIKVITLEGDARQKWLDTAQTAGWDKVSEIDADAAASLRSCMQ